MQGLIRYRVEVGGSKAFHDYKTEQGARRWAASWAARVGCKNMKCDGSYEIAKLTVSPAPEYKIVNRKSIYKNYGNNYQG